MKVVKEEIITKVIRDDGREFKLHQEVRMEEIERLANEWAKGMMEADTEGIYESFEQAKDCALEEIDVGGIIVGFQTRDTGIHLMLWDGREGWSVSIDEII